jgi:hypothetical protein
LAGSLSKLKKWLIEKIHIKDRRYVELAVAI